MPNTGISLFSNCKIATLMAFYTKYSQKLHLLFADPIIKVDLFIKICYPRNILLPTLIPLITQGLLSISL